MLKSARITWASASLFSVVPPVSATASDVPEIPSIAETIVDEIIVTATRRETSLQSTATSIGVLTKDRLDALGALDIDDYWRLVPSLSFFDKGFGGKKASIRGINDTALNGTGAPIVAVYLDDTPLITQSALFQQPPIIKTLDVERVEVLRGPQGTLFGAGSLGGAIRTITRKADPSLHSYSVDLTLSDTAHGGTDFGVSAHLNAPIAKDTSAIRMSAWLTDDSGFIDDVNLRKDGKNSNTDKGFRLSGSWSPSDLLTVTAKAQYQEHQADGFPWEDPLGKPQIGVVVTDEYQSTLLVDDFRNEDLMLLNLNLDYRFARGIFTSSTSYVEIDSEMLIDVAHEGFFNLGAWLPYNVPWQQQQKAFAQEFRFAALPSAKFDWLIGAFHLDDERSELSRFNAPGYNVVCGGCTGQPDGEEFLFGSSATGTRDEAGAFVDVVAPVGDMVDLNVGLRWYRIQIISDQISLGGFFGTPPGTRAFNDVSFDGITGKVSLAYRPTGKLMLYALIANGFREGGSNDPFISQVCGLPTKYDPDSLWNYELGVRSQWLSDGRLTLNATVYVMDWNDAQIRAVSAGCPGNAVINSEGITSTGAEFELSFFASQRFQLASTVGITRSALDKDVPLLNAAAGRRVPYTPDVTASVSATAYPGKWMGFDSSLAFDVQHVGESLSEFTEFAGVLPIVEQPSYTLLNLRAGFERGAWRWTVFANNVTDKKAVLACCGIVGETIVNRPRTIGVRLSYRN